MPPVLRPPEETGEAVSRRQGPPTGARQDLTRYGVRLCKPTKENEVTNVSLGRALQNLVAGPVTGPGDPGYEEARRVYNAMVDRHPAAVVRCTSQADVAAVLRVARQEGLDVAVRGGGHSAPGFGTNDGGLVIDLSLLQDVEVDATRRTARAGGGCTWRGFNEATHAYGLATTGGIVGSTGIGGLTLGGGIGYLARKHGLSCDNLLEAEVVTYEGEAIVANEEDNSDLFWALRGGGGNFGVVTSFRYRLHPLAEIYGGPIAYRGEDSETVLRFYREFLPDAPEELGGFLGFHLAPPLPFLPQEWHLRPICLVVVCWAGDPGEGEQTVRPLFEVAEPVGSHVGTMPYPELNVAFDPLLPKGLQHYWKASFAREISDGAVKVHAEHGSKVPSVRTAVHLYPVDGAVHRVGPQETAFAYRDSAFSPVIAGMWDDPSDNEDNIAWVRGYHEALEPFSEPGGYVNFMDTDDQGRARDNYGANYARLGAVKAKYDPDNLFHLNHNIKPAPAPETLRPAG